MSPYNVLNTTTLNSSPFPQLKPHVRYRTVMERAGFDVAYGRVQMLGQRNREVLHKQQSMPTLLTRNAQGRDTSGGSNAAAKGGRHETGSSRRVEPVAHHQRPQSPQGHGGLPKDGTHHSPLSMGMSSASLPALVSSTKMTQSATHIPASKNGTETAEAISASAPPTSTAASDGRPFEKGEGEKQDTGVFSGSPNYAPSATPVVGQAYTQRGPGSESPNVGSVQNPSPSGAKVPSFVVSPVRVSVPVISLTYYASDQPPVASLSALPVTSTDPSTGRNEHAEQSTREPSIFDFENEKPIDEQIANNGSSENTTPAPNDSESTGQASQPLNPVEKSFMMLTQNTQPTIEENFDSHEHSLFSEDGAEDSRSAQDQGFTGSVSKSPAAAHNAIPVKGKDLGIDMFSGIPKIEISSSAVKAHVPLLDDSIQPIPEDHVTKEVPRIEVASAANDGTGFEEAKALASSTTSQMETLIAQLDDVSLNRVKPSTFDNTGATNIRANPSATSTKNLATQSSRSLKKSSAYLSGFPDEIAKLPSNLAINPIFEGPTDHSSPEGEVTSPTDVQSPVMFSFKSRPLDEIWTTGGSLTSVTTQGSDLNDAPSSTNVNEPTVSMDTLATFVEEKVSEPSTNTIQLSQLTHVASLDTSQKPSTSSEAATSSSRKPSIASVQITPGHKSSNHSLSSSTSTLRHGASWQGIDAEEIHTSPLRIAASVPKHKPGEGPCRSCGLGIKGKGIYSKKEGELSGQWHRECFRCISCNLKFKKHNPCYILDDETYCRQHYHEANNSICRVCHDFIEGECLENDKGETFHINCLTCYICHRRIQEDYYIYNDQLPLCANHDMDALLKNGISGTVPGLRPDGLEATNTLSKRRTRLINFYE
ncbi:Pxl1p Ecym_4029 [Eremothecium cymbalariae DBVPG|uniref:LIM zinc-binding domain-containing protein n=1 Tax=Eremothecium cymbalariae (strain CBS 270.75 / DBVPG 7215 / KCTC 17166 / NRRL Y-17582) TaxID=931890 RepID=G8JSV8_ERECY|nr:hypothetical protein Ecym_4029 [Eremothecium cymbalariae DBVPG\